MFWDPPADHRPSDAEQDMRNRMQPDARTRQIAMAMCDAALKHPADPTTRHGVGPVVYVGLALPGKDYGFWELGQPVEQAPGFFLAEGSEQARKARELADGAAREHLAGRPGTTVYARVDANGYAEMFESPT